MKYIQLQFDSLLNLWCFKEKANLSDIEIIGSRRLLIGELPDAMIELATQQYNARLLNPTLIKNIPYHQFS
jgi:hypothetical protein